MEVEKQMGSSDNTWNGYVDWKGKPASRAKHGGMRAVFFVLVVEVLENLAYLANASNLVLYMTEYMNFSLSEAANGVTNFMGTAFLLALFGGFLSDAFFTSYTIYLVSSIVEFLGLMILTVQAQSTALKPSKCIDRTATSSSCKVGGLKALLLFLGLYTVALGVGGIKGSLPSHGAEQLDEGTANGRKQRSTFFNYFVFSLACGALIAVTLVVWVEDNVGWQWGFGISTLSILLSIPVFLSGSTFYRNKVPFGSPLTTICKVLIASLLNVTTKPRPSTSTVTSMASSPPPKAPKKFPEPSEPQSDKTINFLDRAAANSPAHPILACTGQQVEDVKAVLRILPIYACTVVLNCCLAQLSTFSVQQAATMDRRVGSVRIPPASLPVFPVLFIMVLAPLYDRVIIPFARRLTRTETGISHLRRVGFGLTLSVLAMAVAALVEGKRKRAAVGSNMVDSGDPLPVSFLWVAPQYLFLGSADLFTLAGLMEFFFTEAPKGMRSLATSLSFASLAVGYYLSTVIVWVVNGATGGSEHGPWLAGRNLNYYKLERFYWVMCGLSGLNFLNYLFWAGKYKYRSGGSA